MYMRLLGPSQESTPIGPTEYWHREEFRAAHSYNRCRLRENKRKGRGKRVKNVEEKEETGRRREKFRLKC
jgi:hypothetical protein